MLSKIQSHSFRCQSEARVQLFINSTNYKPWPYVAPFSEIQRLID